MKVSFSVRQKTKIATLLFCIMACTLLIQTLEDRNIKSLNSSFSTLYADRLIPALLLFDISENLHTKQTLINTIYQGDLEPIQIKDLLNQIYALDTSINGFILSYEKTYLLKSEKLLLQELKTSLDESRFFEEHMATIRGLIDTVSGKPLVDVKTAHAFSAAVKSLKALMNIQNQVGEELFKESAFIISDNKIYSAFQTALAVVIGILTVALIFATKAAIIPAEKFRMN